MDFSVLEFIDPVPSAEGQDSPHVKILLRNGTEVVGRVAKTFSDGFDIVDSRNARRMIVMRDAIDVVWFL